MPEYLGVDDPDLASLGLALLLCLLQDLESRQELDADLAMQAALVVSEGPFGVAEGDTQLRLLDFATTVSTLGVFGERCVLLVERYVHERLLELGLQKLTSASVWSLIFTIFAKANKDNIVLTYDVPRVQVVDEGAWSHRNG